MHTTVAAKRIMVIYGTRPEAIKVAPLIKALESDSRFQITTVVTGQHRSMLDQVNQVFSIDPTVDVDVFEHGQSLNALTSKIFKNLDDILVRFDPDAVVIQGDTTTVMAAAVASFYRSIPLVHLEAGLRSHNLYSPFPEEANRKIVSQVASLHLAPTQTSKQNLLSEGIHEDSIAVTGNTVVDALQFATKQEVLWTDDALRKLVENPRRKLLVTAHRRENWGTAMEDVGEALRQVAEKFADVEVVLPAHKNPVVREAILPKLEGLGNVHTCEPLPYLQFSKLLQSSHLVLTDSGGIQEEAPSLGKPVLVMRDNTERPEAVEAGTVRLIGTDRERIFDSVSNLLENTEAYQRMARAINPYGDGAASDRSVHAIAALLGVGERLPDFIPTA